MVVTATITYVLLLLLATGPVPLAHFPDLGACVRNAQRIAARDADEQSRGAPQTYRGFIRAHCERIDR